ncbi:sulfate permease [Microthyrium microscopicum]|uniref:Sulfate permease n=1 Tax=Microthyrium microscopicum TaxID=703497 RepID=A0A6A6TUR5_9PEZI|nr:sulfate permease [Microthyrium microscopicum]
MASGQSRLHAIVGKLPIIGQKRKDATVQRAQDHWFAENHADGYIDPEPTVVEWMKSVTPTRDDALYYIADTFPCSKWLFSYNLQWLIGDLIAGLTVGAVIIPQGMAYAKLAQLPVEYGLYTSFFGGLCYWVFGSSKDINIGPVAVASIVTGTMLTDLEHEFPDQSKAFLAGSIAMLAGAVVAAIGALRLGWLVDLISLPAVSAFISGSAITITSTQIPVLLGIRGVNTREAAFFVLINTLKKLGTVRIDAAMGIITLTLLYIIKWSCESFSKKRPNLAKKIFFASTLRTVFMLLLCTLISYIINRTHKEHPAFRILGFIPKGFRSVAPPKLSSGAMRAIVGQLPAAVIVLIIEHISIGKSFGRINNYTINPNSELLAIGVANLIGPMVGAFASTGSFSRTAINSKAGSRTPMAGVITAALVLLALYTLTPMFYFVPNAALAAVIIHAIGDLITPPTVLYEYWKISPFDVLVFILGLSITIFNSIEHGIFAMVGFSLAIQLFRIFKAHGSLLGQVKVRDIEHNKKTDDYLDGADSLSSTPRNAFIPLDRHDGSNAAIEIEKPYPGIFIYRFTEGFNYPNANHHLDHMANLILAETRPTTITQFLTPGDRPWNDPAPRVTKKDSDSDIEPDVRPTLKAIILDFSAVNNVDLTSVQALIDTRASLARHAAPDHVQWHFASVSNRWTKRALAAAGFGLPSDIPTLDRNTKPIYSFAELTPLEMEVETVAKGVVGLEIDGDGDKGKTRRLTVTREEDIEMAEIQGDKEGKMVESRREDGVSAEQLGRMAAVYGINRPWFHLDIQAALVSAVATVEGRAGMMERVMSGEV